MHTKQTSPLTRDFAAEADEALAAAREMSPGPQKVEALKRAGRLRNSADVYGLIFGDAESVGNAKAKDPLDGARRRA